MSSADPGPASGASGAGRLPDITVETAARSFYKQAVGYGFSLGDFVRFTNALLGIAMAPRSRAASETPVDELVAPSSVPGSRVSRAVYQDLPLAGPRVTVRRFGEEGDRALLDRWVADDDGRFFLLSTASGRVHDVDRLVQSTENLVGMVVFEGRPVGAVAYLDHHPEQRRAELRKLIGDRSVRGRGLAREASELWVGYGLGALGLRKIYLTTLSTHIGNIKINEEIGFRVEGILRNEVLVDGVYRDVLRMGLWHA
jgi:RimJ/RimL family protein N-acetyltransferase